MHILLTDVHLDCRGEGSSNRNASRDESVETGDESVETGDESIEAGEKTPQSCYNFKPSRFGWKFSVCRHFPFIILMVGRVLHYCILK